MAQLNEKNKTHILHLAYDNDDDCSLTVLVNDVRFHFVVYAKDLQKSRDKPLYHEYLDKLTGLRDAEEREQHEADQQKYANNKTEKNGSNDKDSAVDMTADSDSDQDQDSGSASVELRDWIISAFADITTQYAPPREPEESSLYEWYHGPTYFYTLQIKASRLEPELLEESDELNERVANLVPHLKMPQYIQKIDVPWLKPHDLIVQSEVSFPEPAHPGNVVTKDGDSYFFKPVDPSQPGPVKREINILNKLAGLELDIKIPRLLGFVSHENSSTEVMGYLLSPISSPTPLTHFLSSSVERSKRAEWSQKCEKYVKTLHEHGIVWGDAKADNFIVDKDDELWIIDFGGSYTEGWVDPEISETVEGDDMGLEKVVKALENPEESTFDPDAETASSLFVTEKVEGGKSEKRKRDGVDGSENERKRVKDVKG